MKIKTSCRPIRIFGQSTYTADDGVIDFKFANPVFTQALPSGS